MMFLKIYICFALVYSITLILSKEEKYIKKNERCLFLSTSLKKNANEKRKLRVFYSGIRIGQGYDIHKIKIKGSNENDQNVDNEFENKQNFKKLTIGGVKVPNIYVLSHSDGDIIYHSIVDSIFGALSYYDIGTIFSDQDKRNRNKSSSYFLRYARLLLHIKNYKIGNIDINVIAEAPKILAIKDQIATNVSDLLNVHKSQISIKGKTHEKLGIIGKKKAIECFASVLLIPKD